ncbi:nuclease-related domain-containing protein [Halomonas salinarum]|uniref:nuclease-related domain-containing protein n=1 Tax=Halomonas salinarum TaxID=1158993 RepID=UPI001439BC05|nr:nuclease-related domain-containing protein [Halomonas salinarum]
MILKDKDAYSGADDCDTDTRGFYGHKQEQDVAFHLRREFGEHDQIHIINDLRIEYQSERAQIDHLVIHPFGFIIIESKSIVGEVKVNAEGEWSRSYKGAWAGIPSPLRQAELQKKLLHRLMSANIEQLVAKVLGIQTQVGGRDWQEICAVSSTAILHRDKMPKSVSKQVVKTEFLVKKVREIVGNIPLAILKTKPRFSKRELQNISNFLLSHTDQLRTVQNIEKTCSHVVEEALVTAYGPMNAAPIHEEATASLASSQPAASDSPAVQAMPAVDLVSCKSCGETEQLNGLYGQYGYYVKCRSCGANTSMKQPCPSCGWKSVKVTKDGPNYTATCRKCEHQYLVFRQGGE